MAAFIFSGEIFAVLFVLFFVVCFPILIIGIVFFILNRNKKNVAAWQKTSQQIGLPMPNPKRMEMKGIYNNCDVRIAVGVRRKGSGDHSRNEYFTYCATDFPGSLRLRLSIDSDHGFISRAFSANQMKIGNDGFDNNFRVNCYDQRVLQHLMLADFPSNVTQNLMGDLILAKNSIGIIEINDHKIYLERSGQVSDFQTLKNMLDTTAYLSQRFQVARRNLPLADWEKILLQNWQNLAKEQNLSVDSNNFTIQGNYKNFHIKAELRSGTNNWQTKIELKFPNNLMAGLKIFPDNAVHKALTWLGVQDIETGDKAFDNAFIVKAKNVAFAKYILTNDLRAQLVGLKNQASDLQISDEEISITIDSVLGDGKILKSYIEALISTAKMFLKQT